MNHKSITIVGYGNQARAWAENLLDSGWKVSIALRSQSKSFKLVDNEKFNLINIEDIQDSLIAVLTPDHTHFDFFNNYEFKQHSTFIYAHGYSLHTSNISTTYSQYNHVLLAPKAIGAKVRENYVDGIGLAGVYSFELIENNDIEITMKLLAHDLGIKAFYPCTIKQEVIADLFSEQSLLCSVIPYAAKESFNRLVERGIPEELAYFECWHELKLIVDTMVDVGPQFFFDKISPNALLGAKKGQEQLIGKEFNSKLEGLLTDIENGTFYNEIDNSDFEKLQKEMGLAWSHEKLQKTHDRIKPLLNGN